MTLTEEEVRRALQNSSRVQSRVLSDLRQDIDTWFETARDTAGSEGVRAYEIYHSSHYKSRFKDSDGVFRKCKRFGVATPADVYTKVEDLVGLRVTTPNKEQAEFLFGFLKSHPDPWLCSVSGPPKFVSYTITDKNSYSLESGYQAFHVTFIAEKGYRPHSTISTWPVEIQITSELWEFWAGYSHKHFYGQSRTAAKFLPYNVVISRILDAAEDLMAATATNLREESASVDELPERVEPTTIGNNESSDGAGAEDVSQGPTIHSPPGDGPAPSPNPVDARPVRALGSVSELQRGRIIVSEGAGAEVSPPEPTSRTAEEIGAISVDDLRLWFEDRVVRIFGSGVRVPYKFFLAKTAEELNLYDFTLSRLDRAFEDPAITQDYEAVLRASRLSYLPPYQQVLFRMLASLGWPMGRVIDRVNREMLPLGIRLSEPAT
jgi:ppGpp synthetase/RelA/SpoT-type nucleotidyltranferase